MEPLSVDEALQYCLENPDNLSIEELLGKFPQYREELGPLLALDRQLNSSLPSVMPAESKALVRQRLMNRVSAGQAGRTTSPAPAQPQEQAGTGSGKASRWQPRLAVGLAAVLALVLIWWSAASSLPGNPLYQVKLGTENLLLNFAGSQPALIQDHLNLGNIRLVDIRTLAQRNDLAQAGPAVDNYYYHIRNCLTLWQERPDDKDVDLARLLYASSVAGQRVLAAFSENTGQNLPAALGTTVRDSLTAVDGIQSSSAGVLSGAGVDLDQVLQESSGTVADLLSPGQGLATPLPTPSLTAQGTQSASPGATTTTVAGGGTSTPGISSFPVPTLTAVLYAAQTTIAEADPSNGAGIHAAETVIAGGGGSTPITTPVIHAVQTMLAQPTFAVSVEPEITATPLLSVTVSATPGPLLTALPATAVPLSATALPATPVPNGLTATAVPPVDLTPPAALAAPTQTVAGPTKPAVPLATVTITVPLLGENGQAPLTPVSSGKEGENPPDSTLPVRPPGVPNP